MTTSAIDLKIGPWSQLQADAAWVRTRVFVEEQGISRDDEWDAADSVALHCVAYLQGKPIATGRLLPDAHIGRMAVLREFRNQAIASRVLQALMHAGLRRGDRGFELSAQSSIANLYRKHGFRLVSDPYLEVGIEHCQMRFDYSAQTTSVSGHDEAKLHQVDWLAAPDEQFMLYEKLPLLQRPAAAAKGVYLLHGLGEHVRRYDALAGWLVSRGWRVRAHDHRGHGRSDGPRGVLQSFNDLVEDARLQITRYADELGSNPLLLGHSMGGGLAAQLALGGGLPLAGLVLSSPALALGLNGGQRLVLKTLRLLAPRLAAPNGLDADYLSHEAGEVSAYRHDPLVHNKVCARLIDWLYRAGESARSDASNLAVPSLLMVAGDDRLVDPNGSREFAARAGTRHLTVRWYDSAYHELFNEAEPLRQKIVSELGDWLDHHFPASSA